MKKLILAFSLLFASSTSFAQEANAPCGTGPAPKASLDYISMLHENGIFDQIAVENIQNTIFIPLKIHIVGTNTGQGYYSLANLMTNICEMNQKFNALGIQFFLRGEINYINNTSIYNLPSFAAAGAANTQYNVSRVVNVYFANLAAVGACGFANYPNSGEPSTTIRQGAIWLAPGCSGPGNSTFAHEMGHFLSLPHPFDETSDAPAAATSERVTRNTNETAPRFSANCTSAGDRFCDTPADFRPDRWNCPGVNSTVVDLNGDLFQPDGTLYMSYANDACQNKFSPQQVASMRSTISVTQTQTGQNINGPRMYLLVPPMPAYDTITGNTSVVEPANNSTGHPANWVYFKWRQVAGANMYLLRIRRNFTTIDELLVNSADTAYLYTKNTMTPGVQYRISVMPLNHKVTCRTYSAETNFTVTTGFGVNVADVAANHFKVYPSLLQSYAPIKIQTTEESAERLAYQLTDLQGRLVMNGTAESLGGGAFEIPVQVAANGTYFLKLQQGQKTHNQKIVITR
jgi:hypothetical protein